MFLALIVDSLISENFGTILLFVLILNSIHTFFATFFFLSYIWFFSIYNLTMFILYITFIIIFHIIIQSYKVNSIACYSFFPIQSLKSAYFYYKLFFWLFRNSLIFAYEFNLCLSNKNKKNNYKNNRATKFLI